MYSTIIGEGQTPSTMVDIKKSAIGRLIGGGGDGGV